MEQPNEDILIHKGVFYIESEDENLEIHGQIYSEWFPYQSVKFEGTIKSGSSSFSHLKIIEKSIIVKIHDQEFGRAIITNISLGANAKIEGLINPPQVLGDISIPVESIRFSIANLRSFLGTTTKCIDGDKLKLRNSRLSFKNQEFIIKIDQHPDSSHILRLLQIRY